MNGLLSPGKRLRLNGLSHVTCLRSHSLRWSGAVPHSDPKPRLALVGCSSEGPIPPVHTGAWVCRINCLSSPLFCGRITQKFGGEEVGDFRDHWLMCSRATYGVLYHSEHQFQHQTTMVRPERLAQTNDAMQTSSPSTF